MPDLEGNADKGPLLSQRLILEAAAAAFAPDGRVRRRSLTAQSGDESTCPIRP